MTEFEMAMEAYYTCFGVEYPYAIGMGFPGKTDEENIRIIRNAIEAGVPVSHNVAYDKDVDY